MADFPDLVKIQKTEEGLLANRPSLKSVADGAWVWRFAKGYTGRANSVQCLDLGDDQNIEHRLALHWKRSADYGIMPRFRVTPLTPPNVIKLLLAQGFERRSDTQVMEMDEIVDWSFGQVDAAISVSSVTDINWQKDILRLEKIREPDVEVFRQLLAKLPKTSIGLTLVGEDGRAIGAAYASCVGQIGSVFALVIAPQLRGQGLGRKLMRFLVSWLRTNGARIIALQVVADNGPAIGLYKSLGFVQAYEYYYLVGER